MQESARAARSYLWSHAEAMGLDISRFKRNGVHIHVPSGAIPKDGPSAGITMATAIASAMAQIPARRDLAMTGEITLRGRVLPIGGLKEKILAAKRAKLSTVVLPKRNKKDLEEIPKHLLKGIELCFVDTMDDVIKTALRRKSSVKPSTASPKRPHEKVARPAKPRRTANPPRRGVQLPAVSPTLSH